MKKYFACAAIAMTLGLSAQEDGVKKNLTGVQIGLFGAGIYDEIGLSKTIALRAEASFYPTIWGGDLYSETGFALYPAFTLHPKYYYSMNRRLKKGANVKKNGANYFGLQLRFVPDWFVIGTQGLAVANQIHIVPTFGIRRNFGGNFNYEFKAGLGYGMTFGYDRNETGSVLDLGIKIGYDF